MAVIQITIQKNAPSGKGEVAKTYNTAFEGNLEDFKVLQDSMDKIVDVIVEEKNKSIQKKAS